MRGKGEKRREMKRTEILTDLSAPKCSLMLLCRLFCLSFIYPSEQLELVSTTSETLRSAAIIAARKKTRKIVAMTLLSVVDLGKENREFRELPPCWYLLHCPGENIPMKTHASTHTLMEFTTER